MPPRREPVWQLAPLPLVLFLAGAVISGLLWAGALTQRVQAAETKSADIMVKLDRIEDKLDRLIERFLP